MKASWMPAVVFALFGAMCISVSPSAGAAPVEITMWDVPESQVYSDWWRKHAQAFNASHPDIHVTLEVFETEAYRSKIASALSAGTTPEIFYLPAGPQGFQAFRDRQARSLAGLLDATRFTDAAVRACSVEGTLVCMPLYVAPNLMYYNKTLFAAAGIDPSRWADPSQPTWEEFTAACDAIKAKGKVPIALGNGDGWPGTMYLWSYQNRYGGVQELAAAAGGQGGMSFATAAGFRRAARSVAALGKSRYLPLGYNGITGGQKYVLFTAGNAAIIYQGPWLLARIATDAAPDFKFGVFKFPSFKDGDPASQKDVIGGFDALFVNSRTNKTAAIAVFLNSFADPNTALSFMKDTQNVSVIKSVLATGMSPGVINDIAQITTAAPHISPWWDNYLSNAVADDATRTIQGLFDGSIAPDAFLASMDKAAGR
jgi:raffinose/stachyose/melibiose transport system substrate-binding protein